MKSAMAGNYCTIGTVVPVACESPSEVFGSLARGPCCPGRTAVHPLRGTPVHPDQPPQLPEGWEHWFRGHREGDHGGLPDAPRPANRRERYPDPSGTRHLPAAALHASADRRTRRADTAVRPRPSSAKPASRPATASPAPGETKSTASAARNGQPAGGCPARDQRRVLPKMTVPLRPAAML